MIFVSARDWGEPERGRLARLVTRGSPIV